MEEDICAVLHSPLRLEPSILDSNVEQISPFTARENEEAITISAIFVKI